MSGYIGEVRMFAGNYAPKGWAFCNGQILPIRGYEALFSLLGTNYGGSGVTDFALPDLRGRVPISQGRSDEGYEYHTGDKGGAETVRVLVTQIPPHSHAINANAQNGTAATPANNTVAAVAVARYSDQPPNAAMDPRAILPQGEFQPHENMLPYVAINFIIALTTGEFPRRDD